MDVLWEHRRATVAEVAAALRNRLAYTTVLTTLRTLERKGYVKHTTDGGRSYVYAPTVPRDDARRHILDHVMASFFGGSPRTLMLQLVDARGWDDRLAERLRDLLEDE